MNALLRHPEKWTKRESNISLSPGSGKAQDCDQIGPFLCCQTFLSHRTNSNRFVDWSAHRRHHILDRRGRSWLVRQHLVCLHLHCRTAGRARLASALLLRGGDLQGRESAGQSSGVRGRDRLGDSRSFGTLGDDTSFIYGLSGTSIGFGAGRRAMVRAAHDAVPGCSACVMVSLEFLANTFEIQFQFQRSELSNDQALLCA